jgi:hypothetical protein
MTTDRTEFRLLAGALAAPHHLEKLQKLVKQGKVLDVPKQEILMHREYVRKFIHEAGKVLKKKIQIQEEE